MVFLPAIVQLERNSRHRSGSLIARLYQHRVPFVVSRTVHSRPPQEECLCGLFPRCLGYLVEPVWPQLLWVMRMTLFCPIPAVVEPSTKAGLSVECPRRCLPAADGEGLASVARSCAGGPVGRPPQTSLLENLRPTRSCVGWTSVAVAGRSRFVSRCCCRLEAGRSEEESWSPAVCRLGGPITYCSALTKHER